MIEYKRLLDLSTAHIPNTAPCFGPARIREFEYGYVVWVVNPKYDKWETAEWLRPIMEHAYDNDCMLILFDKDADTVEEFKTYDW